MRKFLLRARTLADLVALAEEAASFLEAAVQAGLNILISRGTGSGKTTCLTPLVMRGSRSAPAPSSATTSNPMAR